MWLLLQGFHDAAPPRHRSEDSVSLQVPLHYDLNKASVFLLLFLSFLNLFSALRQRVNVYFLSIANYAPIIVKAYIFHKDYAPKCKNSFNTSLWKG